MNGNLLFLGEAMETLTMLLGVAVAKSDPALADALRQGTKLDCTAGRRRVLDVLAAGLAQQPTPSPAKSTHLKIVCGTEGRRRRRRSAPFTAAYSSGSGAG